jgi:quinolinate synthase
MGNEDIKREIARLKKERNAIILAHVYQRGEVQDIADFTGDSLDLSRRSVGTNADTIVFCGVTFMAETASILNPEKTVLLPEKNAGCGLADMAVVEQLIEKKREYPGAKVVSYVNSSAEIKAESDICCTSANAVDVVRSLDKGVIFVPDRNLGSYVAMETGRTAGRNIILWDGYCYVHENITADKIRRLAGNHPGAKVMVHPECTPDVIKMADYVGSTGQMLRYARVSAGREFIVGTEDGLVHKLQKENSGKAFYPVSSVCEGMKTINLESVKRALERMEHKIKVPEHTSERARKAIERMLELT